VGARKAANSIVRCDSFFMFDSPYGSRRNCSAAAYRGVAPYDESRNNHPHFLQFLPSVQSSRPPFVPKVISIGSLLKAKGFSDQPAFR
jgi:hypothetical protein